MIYLLISLTYQVIQRHTKSISNLTGNLDRGNSFIPFVPTYKVSMNTTLIPKSLCDTLRSFLTKVKRLPKVIMIVVILPLKVASG
ncbi:hypothetical protein AB6735_20065 [Mucilaginibacter sp. RCC_168]|uniref:hypothetical protein n=1 Tax=Mucilaginibacter sp. RCC_168 TaxID=3239221 RepID=UPI0035269332